MATHKDVVCGMTVQENPALVATRDEQAFYFCSDYCRNAFLEHPEQFTSSKTSGVLGSRDDEPSDRHIAYFSMEIAVDPKMPTYSGGLGILAGDTLKSFADLKLPAVGVSLVYRCGYFTQTLSAAGDQLEKPAVWNPSDYAEFVPTKVTVTIENRPVIIRAWRYSIVGATGFRVPVIFLDADDEGNSQADRELTHWLYGGDSRYRLMQELILGVGGVRMLQALGYTSVQRFHMNEGHSALLVLELLKEYHDTTSHWAFEAVRRLCAFTTHTPVPAGHDRFSYDLVRSVVGELEPLEIVQMLGGRDDLNMTMLAMNISHYVNGVAKRHGEVSRQMFAGYPIDSITNGVHSSTWTCESFRRLYDAYIPGWSNDPCSLRQAVKIPRDQIWNAHVEAKRELIREVNRCGGAFTDEAFTIGIARRATPYKRADLLMSDPGQLMATAAEAGPIQIVYAGKARPRDQRGKDMIRWLVQVGRKCGPNIRVVYLENYDMALGRLLTSGADLWLNTPLRPLEASGTSGMKAAHNGVPSFSVLDGWWIERHIEGITGWSIGPEPAAAGVSQDANRQDAEDMYRKLRAIIAPTYYNDRDRWVDVMRSTIAFNGSFFNTHRMVQQYAANAYL